MDPVRIDLHVHTCRYSPCAALLDPDRLPEAMHARGIHGVVLAEHDTMWSDREIATLRRSHPELRFYRGAEISCREGHFIVIGVDRLPRLPRHAPVERMLAALGPGSAMVIFAHPHLHYASIPVAVDPMCLPGAIDAVEVVSSVTSGPDEIYARAIADRRHWHAVGGSDAHCLEHVGAAFTSLPALPADEQALAAALRAGHGLPGRA